MSEWTQSEAIALCRVIEAVCPEFGCHVALTGGALYKDGARKDCDILFYRVRQVAAIDRDGLIAALGTIGLEHMAGHGWLQKATFNGKAVDMFFPEFDDSEFYKEHPEPALVDEAFAA